MRARPGLSSLAFALAAACATPSDATKVEPPTVLAPADGLEFEGQPVDPASVEIKLERTTCFGTCPAYTVTVHGDGRVDWNGAVFVEQVGDRHGWIEPTAVQIILDRIAVLDWFSLPAWYSENVTDMPSSKFTLQIAGRSKALDLYVQGHHFDGGGDEIDDWKIKFDLDQLADTIDSLAGSWRWEYVASSLTELDPSRSSRSFVVPLGFAVRLRRHPEGGYPDYEVTIDAQGKGHWHGSAFVREFGDREFTVPDPELRLLARRCLHAACLDVPIPAGAGEWEFPVRIELELHTAKSDLRRDGLVFRRPAAGPNQATLAQYAALANMIDVIARTERFIGPWDDRKPGSPDSDTSGR